MSTINPTAHLPYEPAGITSKNLKKKNTQRTVSILNVPFVKCAECAVSTSYSSIGFDTADENQNAIFTSKSLIGFSDCVLSKTKIKFNQMGHIVAFQLEN